MTSSLDYKVIITGSSMSACNELGQLPGSLWTLSLISICVYRNDHNCSLIDLIGLSAEISGTLVLLTGPLGMWWSRTIHVVSPISWP